MKKDLKFFWSNYFLDYYLADSCTEKISKEKWRQFIKNTAF